MPARHASDREARRVLRILADGLYETADGRRVSIAEAQAEAEAGTRLYDPEALRSLRSRDGRRDGGGAVEIRAATTTEAARALADDGDVVVLNFASARNPGGGFLNGARAQEEELCRCSGLYPTLLTQPGYYEANRAHRSALYTDHVIHSPRVPFFRLAADSPFLHMPFTASVLTAPAPNAGALAAKRSEDVRRLEETFERRWANVLAAAEDRAHRTLVLGAWGCGAFRNDPWLVAEAAARVLATPRYESAFDRVVFAIPDAGNQSRHNLDAFRSVFGARRREE